MASGATSAPPAPVEVDPGYKTTEFWQTTLTQVVAAAVALVGVFKGSAAGQGEQWAAAISQMVPVVAALLAAFAASRQYVVSRTEVKAAAAEVNAAIAQAHAQVASAHAAIAQAQSSVSDKPVE
jgi:drug/metabolite transporter (DMT)-like permease